MQGILRNADEGNDILMSQFFPNDCFLVECLCAKKCRYETVCQYRTLTLSIAWRSLLLILGHLIHTLAPLKVPSHTSERFVEATSQSPTLASLPEMMCEGGRIRWWLQISCSLFRHRRETSSVTGIIPRAYRVFIVSWKEGGRR